MDRTGRVGIVGGGQLAVMMAEAADELGVEVVGLVRSSDDPLLAIVPDAFVGDATSAADLRRLSRSSDVITFDHELVDHRVIAELEAEGIVFRPGSTALAIATDKRRQAGLFEALELAQPRTIVVNDVFAALQAIDRFDGAAVLKTATGGYDGRGVLLDVTESSIREWFSSAPVDVLVQRAVPIDHELAVQVVRGVDGSVVAYPPVLTVQSAGMCSHVHVPSSLGAEIENEAALIARTIAEAIDVIGLLTVEFFVSGDALLVNELAARPHNSGHLTIEACRTSQFANHLRAVAGLALGSSDLVVPAAAMVNLVGEVRNDHDLLEDESDVKVHLYGKKPRPGHKIGHVTAVAGSPSAAVERAVETADRLRAERVAS